MHKKLREIGIYGADIQFLVISGTFFRVSAEKSQMGGLLPPLHPLKKNIKTARWGLNRPDPLLGRRKVIVQIAFRFIAQHCQLTGEATVQNGLQRQR